MTDWDDPDADIVVPDHGDDEIGTSRSGHEKIVTRTKLQRDEAYKKTARSFLQIKGGVIIFGDRNTSTGAMTSRSTIQPSSYSSYRGIAINCVQLDFTPIVSSDINIDFNLGGKTPVTGYLQVVTNMSFSADNNLEWVIQKIPFRNGICVGDLDRVIQEI